MDPVLHTYHVHAIETLPTKKGVTHERVTINVSAADRYYEDI